ncbi:MAG: DNA polymerase I [Christensenellales bacterium]|jgi:DNA polymerase-1
MNENGKKIAVLDGNSLVYRAFYALPLSMEASPGVYTNAAYGFLTMLLKIIGDYSPSHMAVAFDMHGPTFRHESYSEYKAGRKETPAELIPQFDLVREVLDGMGIKYYMLPSYEADDIMGTIANRVESEGFKTLLVTGDRDSFQLINENTRVLFTRKGISEVDVLTPESLMEKFNITADKVTDLKALMGDSSDNIPGIAGIGEKTALKLLAQFGDLKSTLDGYEQLKGKLRERIENGRESAMLSKKLAEIDCNIPLDFVVDECELKDFADTGAAAVLSKYGFKSILARLSLANEEKTPEKKAINWQRENITDAEGAKKALKEIARADKSAAICAGGPQIAVEGKIYAFALKQSLIDEGMEEDELFLLLKPYFESGQKKWFYNSKETRTLLLSKGIVLGENVDDAMLLEYILDGEAEKQDFSSAGGLYEAALYYENVLEKSGLGKIYSDVELPLSKLLFRMEQAGFTIDAQDLRQIGAELLGQMKDIEQVIYLLAGRQFNILSPKQLGQVLFEELGLPYSKKTKTGYSTDAQVLEGLLDRHDIIEPILEYRMLSKLHGTYIEGLASKADENGRIHTTFYQTGTSTGRLSSADPNLQNIPVRTETGREIRRVFIPSGPENLLIAADYSQIELRVLAHMSGDENFIKAFLDGEDIHAYTAAEVFGVDIKDVTREMRSDAKAVNFGIVYGISDFGLARNINITRKQAAGYIDRFFERYPKVKNFMDEAVAQAKAEGYVPTILGNRRYIPQIKSTNHNVRSFGERIAMNTPIQGSAADIIKLAMLRADEALTQNGLKTKLILQVHDELILDAPKDETERACALLKEAMEGAAALKVPITVDVRVAKNWKDTK